MQIILRYKLITSENFTKYLSSNYYWIFTYKKISENRQKGSISKSAKLLHHIWQWYKETGTHPESLSKEMWWYWGEYYTKFKSSTSSSLHRETLPNMCKNGIAIIVF